MIDIPVIAKKYSRLEPIMDERMRRLWAGAECEVLGHGGIAAVSKATGLARNTICKGLQELETAKVADLGRVRDFGGGRKKAEDNDPTLKADLIRLVEPVTRGEPDSPLLWTCKSLRKLASELRGLGHRVSHRLVGDILHDLEYSLQANRKTLEGSHQPDRNAQFEHINRQVIGFQEENQPVISVDTKKKELLGNFKNNGQEWRPKGEPEKVNARDFPEKDSERVSPYGVYDLGRNQGWVSVGIDHDTAEFAVETIRRWWLSMGKSNYQDAKRLMITADCGGSNGSRVRLWKTKLQQFANETGLEISVCHFPPGTSKWNKIEHRLFAYITQNWRGRPLISREVIVNLIGSTTTSAGLKVICKLDTNTYKTKIKVSDKEFSKVNLKKDDFHSEWNYSICPNTSLNNHLI